MTGLEGRGSALELRPPKQITSEIISTQTKNLMASLPRYPNPAPSQWGEQDSNLRRRCHQIYSLTPLAAREPPQGDKDPSVIQGARKRLDDQADLDSDAGCRYQCRTPIKLSPTGALLPCHPVRIPL